MKAKQTMLRRRTNTEILVVLFAAGLLIAGVASTALADPGSQKWYLTSADYTGTPVGDGWDHYCDKNLSKTMPTGPNLEQLTEFLYGWHVAWWYAENPAECDMTFGSENWTLYLDYRNTAPFPYSCCLYVNVYKVDPNGDMTLLAKKTISGLVTNGAGSLTCELPGEADQSLNASDRIAVRFQWNQHHNLYVRYNNGTAGSGYGTYIQSPGSDPGYPVPELSTLILFSAGLLAVAYIGLRRRNA